VDPLKEINAYNVLPDQANYLDFGVGHRQKKGRQRGNRKGSGKGEEKTEGGTEDGEKIKVRTCIQLIYLLII